MLDEDKRAAANMTVTLSTQLMTASLAIIAVEGAVYTFVLDKRTPTNLFTFLVMLVFFFFILSIYMGGRGVNKVRKAVFDGSWKINDVRDEFAWQALLGVVGLVCLFLSLSQTGKSKEDSTQQELSNLKVAVEQLKQSRADSEKRAEAALSELRAQLEELKKGPQRTAPESAKPGGTPAP